MKGGPWTDELLEVFIHELELADEMIQARRDDLLLLRLRRTVVARNPRLLVLADDRQVIGNLLRLPQTIGARQVGVDEVMLNVFDLIV